MILESVVCVILHCSRCNIPFREDADDGYEGVQHWETSESITVAFNKGTGEYGGWRRFGDRIVCGRCQISNGYADDPDAREVTEPLSPPEADRVARAQTAYGTFELALVPRQVAAGSVNAEEADR